MTAVLGDPVVVPLVRTVLILSVLTLALAGCGDKAPAPAVVEPTPAPTSVTYKLFEGQQDWPTVPGADATTLEFVVPSNATAANVTFSWRGQQPGGYSSSKSAVLVDAAGGETDLVSGDLPANPYACASPRCGPEDREYDFDAPAPGTWTLRLEGAYTATAVLAVSVTATPA